MKTEIRDDGLLDELRALYAQADALLSGWSCPGSTECCRFGITGREPYVTSLELAAIEHALARQGGGRSKRRCALPLTQDPDRERICPLLDAQARCTVYAQRPLGCRTFYCARATGDGSRVRLELKALVRQLQELAARHRPQGELGRPLTRALQR